MLNKKNYKVLLLTLILSCLFEVSKANNSDYILNSLKGSKPQIMSFGQYEESQLSTQLDVAASLFLSKTYHSNGLDSSRAQSSLAAILEQYNCNPSIAQEYSKEAIAKSSTAQKSSFINGSRQITPFYSGDKNSTTAQGYFKYKLNNDKVQLNQDLDKSCDEKTECWEDENLIQLDKVQSDLSTSRLRWIYSAASNECRGVLLSQDAIREERVTAEELYNEVLEAQKTPNNVMTSASLLGNIANKIVFPILIGVVANLASNKLTEEPLTEEGEDSTLNDQIFNQENFLIDLKRYKSNLNVELDTNRKRRDEIIDTIDTIDTIDNQNSESKKAKLLEEYGRKFDREYEIIEEQEKTSKRIKETRNTIDKLKQNDLENNLYQTYSQDQFEQGLQAFKDKLAKKEQDCLLGHSEPSFITPSAPSSEKIYITDRSKLSCDQEGLLSALKAIDNNTPINPLSVVTGVDSQKYVQDFSDKEKLLNKYLHYYSMSLEDAAIRAGFAGGAKEYCALTVNSILCKKKSEEMFNIEFCDSKYLNVSDSEICKKENTDPYLLNLYKESGIYESIRALEDIGYKRNIYKDIEALRSKPKNGPDDVEWFNKAR